MTNPAPGIFTVTLPIPFELESVNVHLVQLDQGFLLVDSGLETGECFDALESGLAERGLGWRDIRLLLLTHLHPDHIGLSWKILELSGARLLMHRIEAEHLALVARDNRSPFFSRAMRSAGVPVDMEARIDRAVRDGRGRFRAHEPHRVLEGGERIPVLGGALEAVWTPGHSPGHVCLYSREHRYLISGDHLLEAITPNISWHPGEDMLASYLESLARIEPLDVDWVLPSHGPPFRGHRERIRATADHHAERCGVILAHLSREPMTGHELAELMWQPKLSPFHHHFAVLEVLAHLEYLERRGRVAAAARNGEALYWKPGTSSSRSS
jgi:glyoxylase-like metal-dependent hydrolase (beta-lactamase superfamily II)